MSNIPTLNSATQIIDPETGFPTAVFVRWWANAITQIYSNIAAVAAAETAALAASTAATNAAIQAVAASTAANTAQLAANAAQATASGALTPAAAALVYVAKNGAARPAYAAYGGQTLGATYSQTAAQATDDAVKALGTIVVSLMSALNTAKVLT